MDTEKTYDIQVSRKTCVCPWQLTYLFDNLLRPLLHNPRKLFGQYVKPGMTVLDIGCGRGFASLGLARLVGEDGLVISADLQPEMLGMVKSRAARAGLSNQIKIHQCESRYIGVKEQLDFVLAFWMVHEVPDTRAFLKEILTLLKAEGRLFIAEPKIHTSRLDFEQTVKVAQELGFSVSEQPRVRFSRAIVLVKEV